MSQRDYYEVLGLQKGASDAEIKKAYRKMAMKYHPDRNPDDQSAEEQFKEVQNAYAILSDSQKKQSYDQFGHAGVDPSMGGGGGFGGHGGFEDVFDDLFSNMFRGGGGRSQSHAERGADLKFTVQLTLEEAAAGKEVEINVPRHGTCQTCEGSGARKGSTPANCETCGGVGQVRIQQGFFSIQQTCPSCHGQGKIITDPCGGCHGQGRVRETKKLSVKIPPGVDTDDRVRLSGEGEAGVHGGPPGDLFVAIHVTKHAIFERDSSNLHCEVPIPFTKAALGGAIEVPTLEGRVTLKIPAETQTGKVFRLRGKGVKSVHGYATGDLMCRVMVETPVNLTTVQKELLNQFDTSLSESGKKHTPKSSSWFDGVKKFFEDMKF